MAAKAPARLGPLPGDVEQVTPSALADLMHANRPPFVLDVRRPEDYLGELGHIDGASLFPIEQLDASLEELGGYQPRGFVLVCDDGALATRAAELMLAAGFSALKVLTGGMRAWLDEGLPVRR